jgi:hypothetical protein
MKKSTLLLFLFISAVCLSKLSAAETSPQFIQGTDTLVVYSDVPGLTSSDKYTIRVRSAATNNEWVQCFANYTYNRYYELPVPATNPPNNMAYIRHCGGWSHTYANVEMSNNSPHRSRNQ